jgi:hypothetical protein
MATTVQVNEDTKQLLHSLKQREDSASHDAIIKKLVTAALNPPKTMFGTLPRIIHLKRKDKEVVSAIS